MSLVIRLACARDSQAWTSRLSLSWGDLEHGAGFVEAQSEGVGFEVVVEGAFGGFVEFLRAREFVGGGVVGFGGILRGIEHGGTP